MSAAVLVRLLAPRPGALLVRVLLFLAVPGGVLGYLIARQAHPHVGLFLILMMVGQLGVLVALGHKAQLAASFAYFQPGLRRGVALAELGWALGLGAAAAGATAALPLPPGVAPPAPAVAFGAAVVVYALLALASFETPWAFQLPVWMFYLFFLVPPLAGASRNGELDAWLTAPLPWLAGAAAAAGLLVLRAGSRRLQRRLCGAIVLGPEDIVRPGRMQALKASRARPLRSGSGMRWRSVLMGRALARAAAAAGRRSPDAVRAWLLVHAGLATSISANPRKFGLVLLALLGMVLFGAYYDGRATDDDLPGWFAALAFSWTALPLYGACYAMNAVLPRPTARGDGLRSEVRVLGGMTALTALLSVAFYGLYVLGGAVLPTLTVAGGTYTFQPPRAHAVLLPVLLGPWLAYAVARWPRPESQTLGGVMSIAFLMGHAAMTFLAYSVSIPIALGATALVGIEARRLRRRWWRERDLPV